MRRVNLRTILGLFSFCIIVGMCVLTFTGEDAAATSVIEEDATDMDGIKLGLLKALSLPATEEDLNASGFYELDGVYSHDELAIWDILWKDDKAQVLIFKDPFVLSVLNVPGVSAEINPYELAALNDSDYAMGNVLIHYNGHVYIFTFNDVDKFESLSISRDK